MDLSRYMNKILRIDYESNYAMVEPGVVLDHSTPLSPKNKFFAPNLSPSSQPQ